MHNYRLPKPTGLYKVGRIAFDLIDNTRHETYSENKNDLRKLVLWIFPRYYWKNIER
jgi:hypothetical protein